MPGLPGHSHASLPSRGNSPGPHSPYAESVPFLGGRHGKPAARTRRSHFVADLRIVLAERNFRRLFATRLISQTGDGVFTAGLGTYVFFNAATFPSPAKGAAAFAVLYLPYSLIGPFAGVFIDRWSRRQILVRSALLRSVLVALTAALMVSGNLGAPLYIAVLLVLGVNRFFLSSLSAALPHVVAGDKLVMANSVSPTVGGVMASLGGIVALGVNAATGNSEGGAAVTLLVAGGCYVAASLVAATMQRDLLGPQRESAAPAPGRLLSELTSVAAGLAGGARYVLRRRGAAAALGATGANRFLYGILFLMSILLYRNYFYPSSPSVAEGHYAVLATVSAIGYGCAALATPPVTRRLAKPAWIALLLAASAVVTGTLGESFDQIAYLIMGFCLGLAGQGVAICATTILQEDVQDAYRGRVFSFYDMIFNIPFVAGAGLSAIFMPLDGRSPAIMGVVAAGYALAAGGYRLLSRQPPGGGGPAGPGAASPSPSAQRSSS
jgi:MFS family permease